MNYAINPALIYQIIDQDAHFIDTRDSHQFEKLHIKNFVNMTPDELFASLLLFSKKKPMYLMCYQGITTQGMVSKLRARDYQAYYIDGGFQAFLNLSQTKYF